MSDPVTQDDPLLTAVREYLQCDPLEEMERWFELQDKLYELSGLSNPLPGEEMKTTYKHVLEIINDLGEPYGNSIRDAYEAKHGRISIGSLYVALDWLQGKEFISSEVAPGGPERSFRIKKIYRVTEEGRKALRESGKEDS